MVRLVGVFGTTKGVKPQRVKPPADFFHASADEVARALLGMHLVRSRSDGSHAVARLVETEAYMGPRDLAAHSRFGRTKRTEVMFGPPGRAYVFLIYGMYSCLNVVTGPAGAGTAVLLRAAEPLEGLDGSTSGPGRLCRAFGIDRSYNGLDLRGDGLWLETSTPPAERIKVTARIGVDYARHWAKRKLRFCLAGNPWVSGPKALR